MTYSIEVFLCVRVLLLSLSAWIHHKTRSTESLCYSSRLEMHKINYSNLKRKLVFPRGIIRSPTERSVGTKLASSRFMQFRAVYSPDFERYHSKLSNWPMGSAFSLFTNRFEHNNVILSLNWIECETAYLCVSSWSGWKWYEYIIWNTRIIGSITKTCLNPVMVTWPACVSDGRVW